MTSPWFSETKVYVFISFWHTTGMTSTWEAASFAALLVLVLLVGISHTTQNTKWKWDIKHYTQITNTANTAFFAPNFFLIAFVFLVHSVLFLPSFIFGVLCRGAFYADRRHWTGAGTGGWHGPEPLEWHMGTIHQHRSQLHSILFKS